jgi:hypothetical protein
LLFVFNFYIFVDNEALLMISVAQRGMLGGGVASWKISSGKISKGGPREKSAEIPPSPGKFR